MHRIKLSLFAVSLLAYTAAGLASSKPAANSSAAVGALTFQFCIMEGVGKQQNQGEAEAMWEPLQQVVNKTLGAKTRFNLFQNFTLIERDIKDQNCDIALIKPVHYAGMAMREYGYEPVVQIGGAYVGNFIVHRDSKLKSYEDLAGKTIMLPDEKSLQSLLAKRYIKEHPLNPPPVIKHTRLQETVLYSVETGLADAGWVNPTLATQWVDKGSGWMTGAIRESVIQTLEKSNDTRRIEELKEEAAKKQRILHKSDSYPYWIVVASKKVNGRSAQIRKALLQYAQDPANKATLEGLGIKKGFLEVDDKARKFYESLL